MPFSEDLFNNEIESLIKEMKFSKYLDVGAGAGKYGKMVKQIFSNAKITGIEIENDYVETYNLREVYDRLLIINVADYIDEYVDDEYDLCIIGDCIEHLKKSDGVDLIEFLIYRAKLVTIIFPSRYRQNSWNGYKNEAHRSIWTEDDFKKYDGEFANKGYMNLVIIKGYL